MVEVLGYIVERLGGGCGLRGRLGLCRSTKETCLLGTIHYSVLVRFPSSKMENIKILLGGSTLDEL
jgi:hypothetical protein